MLSDRYAILGELASGGMASVLYGRLKGPVGFARAVAIKRLHPHIAREPEFVSMFIDEARICARLSHVNIVPTLDVIEVPSELCLVMEYVHGASLDVLLDVARQRGQPVAVRVAVGVMVGVLHGLHAAHEARDEDGASLHIVHRDVSPQNVLLGEDGVARVLDFGIAKAAGKLRTTPSGEVKGKLAYMAPEQFRGGPVDRRVDVRGAAAVLWEVLVGHPLYEGENESALVYSVLNDELRPPSQERDDVSPELDAVIMRALAREPDERFQTAREMALALERQVGGASQSEVHEWVRDLIGNYLDARAESLRRLQQGQERATDVTRDAGLVRTSGDATRRLPASTPPPATTPIAETRTKTQGRGIVLSLLLLSALLGAGWYTLASLRAETHHEVAAPRAATVATGSELAAPREPAPVLAIVPPAPLSSSDAGARAQVPTPVSDTPEAPVLEAVDARSAARAERAARRHRARDASDAGSSKYVRPASSNSADKSLCSPPYWWSSDGVKHYKRECL